MVLGGADITTFMKVLSFWMASFVAFSLEVMRIVTVAQRMSPSWDSKREGSGSGLEGELTHLVVFAHKLEDRDLEVLR